MSKRDEYIAKIKLQLDELNANIGAAETKLHAAKAEVREKYTAEVGTLQEQYKHAVASLDELKAAGEDSWEAMVAKVEKVRDALKHSYNYFKSQL